MITIIDYGMGNLRSVSKALEHLGASVKVSDRPEDLLKAEKIVLPGVGAFGDAMKELGSRKLIPAILACVKEKKKFLGICLGMQLLFESSEESPGIQGLGIFRGDVQKFRSKDLKIPHMGWNSVSIKKSHALLNQVSDGSFFYFVHSFYVVPKDPKPQVIDCTYGKETFPAMIGNDFIFATQFHPEKSQEAGLSILKNFIEW